MPLSAKIIFAVIFGYTLLPFDIIPDFIPLIGYLDEAIILPLLVIWALILIRKEAHHKHKKLDK